MRAARINRALVAALLAIGLAGAPIVGCSLRGQLSEQAQPQTPAAEFVVAVAEFNRLAGEANIWMDGVLAAARAGDPEAGRYLAVAERIQQAISAGNVAIQGGQEAIANGNLDAFLRDGQALNRALALLQAEFLAAGIGVDG